MPTGQIDSLRTFLTTTLWELNPDGYPFLRRYAVKYLQITLLVAKGFMTDLCPQRAAALSFTTILSLVPFCALMFALLKGLGVQNRLEPLLLEQVAAGSQEVVSSIIGYINNTNMASMGAIGLVTLLITVVSLLGSVEEAFNAIWGVSETRSLQRRFSDYLSVVVSGPLLLFAATSVTTSLQSQTMVRWLMTNTLLGGVLLPLFRLVPYVSIWLAMIFLYLFIPNTRVRLRSALVGGVLAGTSWEVAQWGYLHFQVGVSKYNAIYGTLAALPVFMVWIYTSWLIVLLGVEVVYAHQNIRTFRREERTTGVSQRTRELLTLAIMTDIARTFLAGMPPWNADTLAEDLDLPIRIVREITSDLCSAGFLARTAETTPGFLPGRELDQITVHQLLSHLQHHGSAWRPHLPGRNAERLNSLLASGDRCRAESLAGLTLRDLATGETGDEDTGNEGDDIDKREQFGI